MQYIQCKFRREDSRSYTYAYDGAEPLAIDDEVKVPDRSGDGWKKVYVSGITDEAPSFPCKPILGIYNPDIEPEEPASEKPAVKAAKALLDLDGDEITF